MLARYLRTLFIKQLLWSTFCVLLLVWNVSFVVEVKRLQEVTSMWQQLKVATLLTPIHFLPYALCTFVLALGLFFHTMRCNQTLLVLQALGISMGQVVRALWRPCWIVSGLVFLLSAYLAPWCANLAQQLEVTLTTQGQAVIARKTLWLRTHDGFMQTVYDPTKRALGDSLHYHYQDNGLNAVTYMDRLRYVGKRVWASDHPKRVRVRPDQGGLETQYGNTMTLGLKFYPGTLEWIHQRPKELTMDKLIKSLYDGKKIGLNASFSWVFVWFKWLLPLEMIAYYFILSYAMQKNPHPRAASQTITLVSACVWVTLMIFVQAWISRVYGHLDAWHALQMVATQGVVACMAYAVLRWGLIKSLSVGD